MGIVLMLLGIAITIAGLARARRPWGRYQELKAQDQNVARYEAWRGGVRNDAQTGASIAMAVLRRQAQAGATVAAAGLAILVVGFLLR